jgi:hypothetical protein
MARLSHMCAMLLFFGLWHASFLHLQHVDFPPYMVHAPKLSFLPKIGPFQQGPNTKMWLILSQFGDVRSLYNLLQIVELSC